MGAGSCGLRRFFTSLYSLPSFLLLLGAASLEPSLQQTHVNHIYCFDFGSMQIFLYESIAMTAAVGLRLFGENIYTLKQLRISSHSSKALIRPTCYWSSAELQRAAVSWHGSCLGSVPEQLPGNWKRHHTACSSHSLWPGWPGLLLYTEPEDTGQGRALWWCFKEVWNKQHSKDRGQKKDMFCIMHVSLLWNMHWSCTWMPLVKRINKYYVSVQNSFST